MKTGFVNRGGDASTLYINDQPAAILVRTSTGWVGRVFHTDDHYEGSTRPNVVRQIVDGYDWAQSEAVG